VSHDLKAPLRGIDGYSRLLQEQYDSLLDEEGQLFLGNVREGVEQMNRLINDLLAYSRMERRKLQNKLIDIRQQVEKILAESREQIQATGAIISVNVDDIYARADLDGFAIVVRNLLDNALKFSRDSQPPTIQISATRQEKSIILEIKDNGIGFDMQFHERIFEIFQRLQRAEDYPGTGVGLAIVAKAIKRMNGRVWAESTPGAGATFFVELAQ
jgi:signal transduction histidine kinase